MYVTAVGAIRVYDSHYRKLLISVRDHYQENKIQIVMNII